MTPTFKLFANLAQQTIQAESVLPLLVGPARCLDKVVGWFELRYVAGIQAQEVLPA